jgi:hypothetical protein
VPERTSFDYAVLRVVPRVDREEFINAGVIVFCVAKDFLAARVELDEQRLRALDPDVDVASVREHLEAFPRICAGGPDSGPIGKLPVKERWHWLVAPRSTVVQVSPVHSGLTDSPRAALDRLVEQMVLTSGASSPASGAR